MSRGLALVLLVGLVAVTVPLAMGRPAPEPERPQPTERLVLAAGVFVVARRDLPDPNFRRAVVLIVQHDERGTLGLIVNHRTRHRLHDALPDLPGAQAADHPLYLGGPVGRTMLAMLLRNEKPGKTIDRVTDEVSFCADRDVLERLIANKKSPTELRLYLGHAGWAGGQLTHELARGDWYLAKSDGKSIFGDVENLWNRLIDELDPPGFEVRQRPDTTRPRSAREASRL